MAANFRDEFSVALVEAHFVCKKYVTEDGLSLDNKKAAVECSMNLLIEMLVRLPQSDRDRAVMTVTRMLPSYVATEVANKG